jgi:membrane protein DedA with SNARE-associated domain
MNEADHMLFTFIAAIGVLAIAVLVGFGMGYAAGRSELKKWVKKNCCYLCYEKLRYGEDHDPYDDDDDAAATS